MVVWLIIYRQIIKKQNTKKKKCEVWAVIWEVGQLANYKLL